MNASMEHPVWLSREELLHACNLQFKRASGPGGQNRNKVETGVVLTHRESGSKAEATERRTQGENKDVAVMRLRLVLASQIRTPPTKKAADVLAKYRNRQGKLAISETNWEWPIVLAELLNICRTAEWNISEVAAQLETSSSQIVKLLKQSPPAFKLLNDERTRIGLGVLKP